MEAVTDIGTIEILRSQHDFWRTGRLRVEWARRFPELFDEKDVRTAEDQGDYHFVEWLAAIVLYHATGYLSLIESYEFRSHRRKQEIVQNLFVKKPDVLVILADHNEHGRVQAPDLLMYAPDHSDSFFCEVKGPGDRLSRKQRAKFEVLAEASGKPVRLLHFTSPPGGAKLPAGL